MSLSCPRHGDALQSAQRHGLEVERCPVGDGIWIDHHEMELLEDRAAGDELVKGQMRYGRHESDLNCPHCGKLMARFRYRAYDLEVDECPDKAGFWLDKGEDKKIQEIIKRRGSNLQRSGAAEAAWHAARRGRGKRSLLDRVKDMFRGR